MLPDSSSDRGPVSPPRRPAAHLTRIKQEPAWDGEVGTTSAPLELSSPAPHVLLTCPSPTPHLPLTYSSSAPHVALACSSPASHLPLTCPSPSPHLPLTCSSPAPHLPLNWPSPDEARDDPVLLLQPRCAAAADAPGRQQGRAPRGGGAAQDWRGRHRQRHRIM